MFLGALLAFAVGCCQRQDGLNRALVFLSSGSVALDGLVFFTVILLLFMKSVRHVTFQTHSKPNCENRYSFCLALETAVLR